MIGQESPNTKYDMTNRVTPVKKSGIFKHDVCTLYEKANTMEKLVGKEITNE